MTDRKEAADVKKLTQALAAAATTVRSAVAPYTRPAIAVTLDLAGAGAIVTGLALWSVPLAFIAAGAAALAVSWRLNR